MFKFNFSWFENAPIYSNLNCYTFLLLLIVFSLLLVLYWVSRNSFIWLSITKMGYKFFFNLIFNFIDLVMKYYIRTVNLERSMKQILSKIIIVVKRCKNMILCKKSNRRFPPMHWSSRCPTLVFNKELIFFFQSKFDIGCLEFKYFKNFSALISFLNMQKYHLYNVYINKILST